MLWIYIYRQIHNLLCKEVTSAVQEKVSCGQLYISDWCWLQDQWQLAVCKSMGVVKVGIGLTGHHQISIWIRITAKFTIVTCRWLLPLSYLATTLLKWIFASSLWICSLYHGQHFTLTNAISFARQWINSALKNRYNFTVTKNILCMYIKFYLCI